MTRKIPDAPPVVTNFPPAHELAKATLNAHNKWTPEFIIAKWALDQQKIINTIRIAAKPLMNDIDDAGNTDSNWEQLYLALEQGGANDVS